MENTITELGVLRGILYISFAFIFAVLKIHEDQKMRITDLKFREGLYLFDEELHIIASKCSTCNNNIRFKTNGMCVWCFHHGKHSTLPTTTDEDFEIYWA